VGYEEVWRWRRSRHLADGLRPVRYGAVRVGVAWFVELGILGAFRGCNGGSNQSSRS
jgi:hypothetical protein